MCSAGRLVVLIAKHRLCRHKGHYRFGGMCFSKKHARRRQVRNTHNAPEHNKQVFVTLHLLRRSSSLHQKAFQIAQAMTS